MLFAGFLKMIVVAWFARKSLKLDVFIRRTRMFFNLKQKEAEPEIFLLLEERA